MGCPWFAKFRPRNFTFNYLFDSFILVLNGVAWLRWNGW
jgi:hypothetical protein